jgi:hypothetical protein
MEFNQRQNLSECCSNPAGHHKLLVTTWKLTSDEKKSATQLMCQYCAAVFNASDVTTLHQKRCSQTCAAPSGPDLPESL